MNKEIIVTAAKAAAKGLGKVIVFLVENADKMIVRTINRPKNMR